MKYTERTFFTENRIVRSHQNGRHGQRQTYSFDENGGDLKMRQTKCE